MSALEEFPAELALKQDGRSSGWMLVITGPDVHGSVVSSSRDMVLGIAEAYVEMRREQVSA